MDKRSLQYIKDDDGGYLIHFPKRITKKIMQDSYQIFAMDLIILNILNTKFKKYINKIKLFNYQDRKINLDDPYQYDLDNYNKIMSNIKKSLRQLNSNIKYSEIGWMAEWSCSGLQSRLRRFDSGFSLHIFIYN